MWKFLKIFCCVSEREEPVFAPEILPEQPPEPAATLQTTESVLHSPAPRNDCGPKNIERSPSTDTLDTSASVTPSKAAVDSLFLRPSSQKKLIRRVSSMTTKEHREFRFFLPHVSDSDDWINKEAYESYSNAVELLLRTFQTNQPSAAVTSRHDSYLIGKAYFGIKYNDEGRLEMKARTENRPIWMEKWSKVRFGKKEIANYKNDILTYLSDVGHKDPTNEDLIDNPSFVNVISSKQQFNLNSVAAEVSELTIKDHTSPKANESAAVSLVTRRQWLSIIIGGDSTAIESYVRNQQESKGLFNALRLCHDIYQQQTDDALHHTFLPVVSGYPLWLRLVSNSIGDANAVHDEIMPAVESFLMFLALHADENDSEDDVGRVVDIKPFDYGKISQRLMSAEE